MTSNSAAQTDARVNIVLCEHGAARAAGRGRWAPPSTAVHQRCKEKKLRDFLRGEYGATNQLSNVSQES